MSYPSDLRCSLPPVSTEGAADKEPATTVFGPAPPEGAHSFAPPQEMVSSSSLDDLWRRAFENYGLLRPTNVTEIHVFRVILQSSRDKNACTRSVTRTGPMSDPFQTLEPLMSGGTWNWKCTISPGGYPL